MKYLLSFSIFIIIGNVSCTSSTEKESKIEVPTSTSKYQFLDSISCDSALYLLVKSSGITIDLKNKTVTQDGLDNDTLLVKVSHENEAEPEAMVDVADGFLTIDLKNKKLYQNVIEVDSLKELKCDENILNHYVLHCAK